MKYVLRINGKRIPCITEIKPKIIPDFWSGRKERLEFTKYELMERLDSLLSSVSNTDIFQIKLIKEGRDKR
jgi:hypothetical protein